MTCAEHLQEIWDIATRYGETRLSLRNDLDQLLLAIKLPLGLRLAGFSAKMMTRLSKECFKFGSINLKNRQPSYYARVEFSNSGTGADFPIMLYVMFNPYMTYEKEWWEETIDALYKDVLKAYNIISFSEVTHAFSKVSAEKASAISKFIVNFSTADYVLTPIVINDFMYSKSGLIIDGDFRLKLKMDFSLTEEQVKYLYEHKDSVLPFKLRADATILESDVLFHSLVHSLYYKFYSYEDGLLSMNITVSGLHLNKEESMVVLPEIIECSVTKD